MDLLSEKLLENETFQDTKNIMDMAVMDTLLSRTRDSQGHGHAAHIGSWKDDMAIWDDRRRMPWAHSFSLHILHILRTYFTRKNFLSGIWRVALEHLKG